MVGHAEYHVVQNPQARFGFSVSLVPERNMLKYYQDQMDLDEIDDGNDYYENQSRYDNYA